MTLFFLLNGTERTSGRQNERANEPTNERAHENEKMKWNKLNAEQDSDKQKRKATKMKIHIEIDARIDIYSFCAVSRRFVGRCRRRCCRCRCRSRSPIVVVSVWMANEIPSWSSYGHTSKLLALPFGYSQAFIWKFVCVFNVGVLKSQNRNNERHACSTHPNVPSFKKKMTKKSKTKK